MKQTDIFDKIKGALTSFGQARRIAASLAELSEEKQEEKIQKILQPNTLTVVTCLEDCWHCRHNEHTGAFTPGGPKRWCKHPSGIGRAKKQKIIKNPDKFPHDCPLKLGEQY